MQKIAKTFFQIFGMDYRICALGPLTLDCVHLQNLSSTLILTPNWN